MPAELLIYCASVPVFALYCSPILDNLPSLADICNVNLCDGKCCSWLAEWTSEVLKWQVSKKVSLSWKKALKISLAPIACLLLLLLYHKSAILIHLPLMILLHLLASKRHHQSRLESLLSNSWPDFTLLQPYICPHTFRCRSRCHAMR